MTTNGPAEAERLLAELNEDDDWFASIELLAEALAAAYQRGRDEGAEHAVGLMVPPEESYKAGVLYERERIRAALDVSIYSTAPITAKGRRWLHAILDAEADR